VSNETEHPAKELSKQTVEEEIWFLLISYSKMQEKRG
jgi:hypothetical protein